MKATALLLGVVIGSLVGPRGVFLVMGGAAQVAADCPGDPAKECRNGNVNGGGRINVTDVVYVLQGETVHGVG